MRESEGDPGTFSDTTETVAETIYKGKDAQYITITNMQDSIIKPDLVSLKWNSRIFKIFILLKDCFWTELIYKC